MALVLLWEKIREEQFDLFIRDIRRTQRENVATFDAATLSVIVDYLCLCIERGILPKLHPEPKGDEEQ